ncbi:unnamed protein product [Rotaria sp. Silwood2]|nr:unnamed protein product [Rotaria sp. Silwood2]CAF3216547.1 unnamed protein product [Rotaria sp. Silwood2]CAF4267269.1 unnamed protein product [Rotaria sp. Silwood2]
MVVIIKGRILPVLTVRVYSLGTETVTPKIREFDSYSDLEKFIRDSADPIVLPGVTLFLKLPWLGNIGHTLFDGLYPAYIALIRFPPRHLHPFRLLCAIDECKTCRDEDIFNRFAGLGIIKHYVLNDMSNGSWFVFDEFVMGDGMMRQRCTQPNLQLPGGVELDGSRLFRDRLYAQHGVIPPTRRYKHSAEGRNRHDVLHAYVMGNKRFTDIDKKEINAAINEINNYTILHQNKSITDINKLDWPLLHVSRVYYSLIKGRKRTSSWFNATPIDARSPTYELIETYFTHQLRLLRTMDIQIIAPGTGAMYQSFVPDGSVVINVGGLISSTPQDQNITYTAYMEQYMASGAPYLKALYYPINERPKGIKREELVKLIREAAKLIMNGFSIPVNPTDNLAADGQLFIEMCEKDKKFCELVTARAPDTAFACYDFWVEKLIHELGPWREEVGNDGIRRIQCPYNQTLMRTLRDKYDIRHYEISINQSKISR